MTLTEVYAMRQVKAEHTTTTYKEFQKSIVGKMARSILMPYNVASGDSSGHNFSSAKMDRLSWDKVLLIRQTDIKEDVLAEMFMSYWNEAVLTEGELPAKVRRFGYRPRLKWFFDGVGVIDELKEAKADQTNLESGATNFATVYAKSGKNWKDEFRQRAEEKAEMDRLDLSLNDFIADVVPQEVDQEDVNAHLEQVVEEILDDRLIK